jgi:hypothetical protein
MKKPNINFIPLSVITGKQLANILKKLKGESLNDCWEWQARTNVRGRGRVTINRKSYLVTRLIYKLTQGEDPGPMLVLHRCDNPRCCNPFHLYKGNHKQNAHDRDSRKRKVYPRGERVNNAKLNPAKVTEIRRRWAARKNAPVTFEQLATEYGVSLSLVKKVVWREVWRDVA